MPTIIYGFFALLVVTPLLQKIFPELPGFNILSAGMVMGVMIIPYVASLSEDAMRAVPMSLREGAYAMGARASKRPSRWWCPPPCRALPRPTSWASAARWARP